MKKIVILLAPFFVITQLFGIASFGLSVNQGLFNIEESNSSLFIDNPLGGDPLNVGTFTHHGFKNGYGLGGYVYIDIIPVVDIDFEGNIMANIYNFSFDNQLTEDIEIDNLEFGWIAASSYITVHKKLFKVKIPILAKAKLTGGLGVNNHSSIPMVNQDMLEAVMGGPENLESGELDTDALITYLSDNQINSTGVHAQIGLQVKLLFIDSFIYYRQIIAKDSVPGRGGFGSLNIRLGMAI